MAAKRDLSLRWRKHRHSAIPSSVAPSKRGCSENKRHTVCLPACVEGSVEDGCRRARAAAAVDGILAIGAKRQILFGREPRPFSGERKHGPTAKHKRRSEARLPKGGPCQSEDARSLRSKPRSTAAMTEVRLRKLPSIRLPILWQRSAAVWTPLQSERPTNYVCIPSRKCSTVAELVRAFEEQMRATERSVGANLLLCLHRLPTRWSRDTTRGVRPTSECRLCRTEVLIYENIRDGSPDYVAL